MWDALADVFTFLIGLVNDFVHALIYVYRVDVGGQVVSEARYHNGFYRILPLFAIGIAVSLVFVCVRLIRRVCWGVK